MSVLANIEDKVYENTAPYPERPEKLVAPGRNATSEELKKYLPLLENYEKAHAGYTAAKRAWSEANGEAQSKFEPDLAKEFGLTDHPKRAKVFSMAWERGHSSGLESVYNEYSDLVDLIL